MRRPSRLTIRLAAIGTVTLALLGAAPLAASADPSAKPDPVALLEGYDALWTPQSHTDNTMQGTVNNASVLAQNDELVVWINTHATTYAQKGTNAQQFRALQDSLYGASPDSYDQSITASTALGSVLGPLYVKGRQSGALPLTTAIVNDLSGTAGAYVSTSGAKKYFSYPRPYLPTNPNTPLPEGWSADCTPSTWNGGSLASIRDAKPYTVTQQGNTFGNLSVTLVPSQNDTSGMFTAGSPLMDPGYGPRGSARAVDSRADTRPPRTRPTSRWPLCCPNSRPS